jgi:hypothetical protein
MPFDSKQVLEVLILTGLWVFLSWWAYSVLAACHPHERNVFDRTVKRRVTLVVLGPLFFASVISFFVFTGFKMMIQEGAKAVPRMARSWRQKPLAEVLAQRAAQRREKRRVRRARFLSDA